MPLEKLFHELLGLGLNWEVIESRFERERGTASLAICEITWRLPRGKCRQCGHVFRVRPPWEGLSTHFTKEFEAFALLRMREMPMSKVGELVGETDTRLGRMLFRQVNGGLRRGGLQQRG